MKNLFAILILFFAFSLSAQNAESVKIKASDPSQIYTFVEAYAGLNFLGQSPTSAGLDTWEAGFRGTWGIKKFRIGVHLPASNNQSNFEVFDDITLDVNLLTELGSDYNKKHFAKIEKLLDSKNIFHLRQ